MEKVKLGEIALLINGDRGKNYPSQEDITDDGEVPFVNAGHLNGKNIDYSDMNYISQEKYEKLSSGKFEKGDILYCLRGSLGKKAIVNDEVRGAIASSLVIIRPDRKKVNGDYLMFSLDAPTIREQLTKANNGSTQPNLSASSVREFRIELPTLLVQKDVVEKLTKLQHVIEKRQNQINLLDKLVKARFVEMFGDPVHNSLNQPVLPMTDVCEIIDGDRGVNYPKQEDFYNDEHCLFLNAKNVTKKGFDFSECMFITKEKDEQLRKGKLKRGDVVLTTRGTLGNIAFYTKDIPFDNVRINSGMVILRLNRDIIDETFFIEQFRMQVDSIKTFVASGSAQPQLPISTMNKIKVLMPDLELQKQYSQIIEQTDKSKVVVPSKIKNTIFAIMLSVSFGQITSI